MDFTILDMGCHHDIAYESLRSLGIAQQIAREVCGQQGREHPLRTPTTKLMTSLWILQLDFMKTAYHYGPRDHEVRINCVSSGRAPGAQILGSAKGNERYGKRSKKKKGPYCGNPTSPLWASNVLILFLDFKRDDWQGLMPVIS
jgi:hypothetical protein